MADQEIDLCKKCGTPFDETNTGLRYGRRRQDGEPGAITRFCRVCAKRMARESARRARPQATTMVRPDPVRHDKPRPPRVIDHAECEPWGEVCCEECRALYLEVATMESGGIGVDAR